MLKFEDDNLLKDYTGLIKNLAKGNLPSSFDSLSEQCSSMVILNREFSDEFLDCNPLLATRTLQNGSQFLTLNQLQMYKYIQSFL